MTLHTEPPALAESRIFSGTVLNVIEFVYLFKLAKVRINLLEKSPMGLHCF